jgi:hypothetical protein
MTTQLKELLAMPIVGNADSDMPALKLADQIITNRKFPMEDRIRAMQRLDEITGEDDGKVIDEGSIERYTICVETDDWSEYDG